MTVALNNLPNFPGLDGLPLSAGYVYIGIANLDPVANPLTVWWDAAMTTPATQPLRTTGGYVANSGAPANVYIPAQFSLKVTDVNGVQVFYAPQCPGHTLAEISVFMNGFLTKTSAASARTTLGLGSDGTTALRNRLHNGSFRVNQRAVTGTVTLAAGAYGFDRWKAGAAGCTFTFAASNGGNIVTITSGSLQQVIEDKDVEGGVYALSNQGTAQGRVSVNGAATSGSYAAATTAAPVLSANATGGQTMTVEFSTGTLDRVQLEPGTAATVFERRPMQMELALCQRYLPAMTIAGVTGDKPVALGQCFSTVLAGVVFPFAVTPRIPPTGVAVSDATLFILTTASGTQVPTTVVGFGGATSVSAQLLVNAAAGLVAGNATMLRTAGGVLWFTGCEL